jgi:hypothetical protein
MLKKIFTLKLSRPLPRLTSKKHNRKKLATHYYAAFRQLEEIKGNLNEKDTRYLHNVYITEFFANKCKFPQKYLNDMITLAQDMVQITRVPSTTIRPS